MTAMDPNQLRELGQQFRVDSIRPAAVAKSGHPTSGMSAADLMAVLVANHLRYDFGDPKSALNDRLIFSKGHASTLYYAILRAAGAITDDELLTYRKFGSMLEGHPTPLIPWVDVATGSLGQGLPIGVGMGLAAKYLDRLPTRVWVLCGDSEMAEGSRMPKKITANGTQAVIGIGRIIWISGSTRFSAALYQPIRMPTGTPTAAARMNPASTRRVLAPACTSQLPTYRPCCGPEAPNTQTHQVWATVEGAGTS